MDNLNSTEICHLLINLVEGNDMEMQQWEDGGETMRKYRYLCKKK